MEIFSCHTYKTTSNIMSYRPKENSLTSKLSLRFAPPFIILEKSRRVIFQGRYYSRLQRQSGVIYYGGSSHHFKEGLIPHRLVNYRFIK